MTAHFGFARFPVKIVFDFGMIIWLRNALIGLTRTLKYRSSNWELIPFVKSNPTNCACGFNPLVS